MRYLFDKKFFKDRQRLLLSFVNTSVGRWFFRIHGKRSSVGHNKITEIGPHYIKWSEGFDKKVELRTHNKYAKRLKYGLYPIWWLAHQWDMLVANNINPAWNLGFDTLTVYPDADPETNSVDGVAYYFSSELSWEDIVTANGTGSTSSSTTDSAAKLRSGTTTDRWDFLVRGIFQFFADDTIRQSDRITAAIFSVYGQAKSDANSMSDGQAGVALCENRTPRITSIASGDFQAVILERTRAAFIDENNDELRMYEFDENDWLQKGNSLAISSSSKPSLTALSSTRIAYIDDTNDDLRTYEWDGSNWSQTGNDLNISGVSFPSIVALSLTRIALYDAGNAEIRTYDFDGTDWSQTGNGLSVSAAFGAPKITALSSTRIAYMNSSDLDEVLETYDFDGTDWSQVGNSLSIEVTSGEGDITALSSTRIAFWGNNSGYLGAYDFDGSDWSLVGNELLISGNNPSITTLSSGQTITRIAVVDANNDDLRTYDFDGTDWELVGNELNVAGIVYPALAAMSSLRFSTDIGFSSLSTSSYNNFALNVEGISYLISKVKHRINSKFSTRFAADIDARIPNWVSGQLTDFTVYMADQTGTTNDPKLVITYTDNPRRVMSVS